MEREILLERIGGHSHIRGLGVYPNLQVEHCSDGLVGQESARRAAAIVLKMIRKGQIGGRAILLSGQPGTGKTAIALGLAKELGEDTPFVHISGSELFSLELSKCESLTQGLRRAIGIHIEEESDVIEGEVVELELSRSDTTGQQIRQQGRMTIATTDMETLYTLGAKMIEQLEKKRVTAGDVIQIVKSSGVITRLGRSIARAKDFDAHGVEEKFIPCPEGELHKRTTVTHKVSLHDLDVINSRSQGFLALFAGDTGEIKADTRSRIDERVAEWRRENKAKIVPGVLFIDEVHALDEECFSFLNRALEAPLAPLLIMATNRGVTRIKGTDYRSPHGIPLDLLDRCLIIPTDAYSEEDMCEIIRQRSIEEGFQIDDTAVVQLLGKIAKDSSLRYALHLLTLSYTLSIRRGEQNVTTDHVQHCYTLFADTKRSAQYLLTAGSTFLFNDVQEE